jgi:hypothetical protein
VKSPGTDTPGKNLECKGQSGIYLNICYIKPLAHEGMDLNQVQIVRHTHHKLN